MGVVFAFWATVPCRAQVVALGWDGEIEIVFESTGDGLLVDNAPYDRINAMARDDNGRLIASTTDDSGPPRLIRIDEHTLEVSVVPAPTLNDIRGLAFYPGQPDLLLAIDSFGAGTTNRLYALDLAAGTKTLIGQTDITGITALTFAPSGVLYAWSAGHGLIVIDPFTASTTDVDGTLDGSSAIQTLFFGPGGVLYGAKKELYVVDVGTGAITPVGGGGLQDIRGAEYVPNLCDSSSFCRAIPNSTGLGAHMSKQGTSAIGAGDFVLRAEDCPPAQFGVFFYGSGTASIPFGDGVLCIGGGEPGLIRLDPPAAIDASGLAARPLDFTQPPASSGPGAITGASVWYFQFWYRDPAAAGAGFNLSDAMSVIFCP